MQLVYVLCSNYQSDAGRMSAMKKKSQVMNSCEFYL